MSTAIRKTHLRIFSSAELHFRQWYRSLAANTQEELNAAEAFHTEKHIQAVSLREIIECALEEASEDPTSTTPTLLEREGATRRPTKLYIFSE